MQGFFTLRGEAYKIQDADGDVFYSMVVRLRKMQPHSISLFLMSDVEKVTLESLYNCVFGLAYILFFAGFACDTVDQIGTLASNVIFAGENFTSGCTGESWGFVQIRAKFALKVGAFFSWFFEVHQGSRWLWYAHLLVHVCERGGRSQGSAASKEVLDRGLFGSRYMDLRIVGQVGGTRFFVHF